MVLNITTTGTIRGSAINSTLLQLLLLLFVIGIGGLSARFELLFLVEAKPLGLKLINDSDNTSYTLVGNGRFDVDGVLRNSETLKQQPQQAGTSNTQQTVNNQAIIYHNQKQQQQQNLKQQPTSDNYLVLANDDLAKSLGTQSSLLLQAPSPLKRVVEELHSTRIQPTASATIQPPHGRASLRKALLSLQNPRLLGGDILIRTGSGAGAGAKRGSGSKDPQLVKYERSALVSPVSLWPNGVIYYELDSSVSHVRDLIWKVMQQFHDETCIRFIPRQHNEPDFLHIESVRGCFSYIGRIGGEQTLSLSDGCEFRGTIAHELLHAVGFYHHQNRSDRDDYLEIVWENIAKGKENQFSKMEPDENTLLNEFDYNSIMLYGPHTFGRTLDKVTMKPKRDGVILLEVVEKQGLSLLDIDSVNKLYKCKPYDRLDD